jgi:hypothetical protein
VLRGELTASRPAGELHPRILAGLARHCAANIDMSIDKAADAVA